MLTIIIFLFASISTSHASLKFALCTKVNERPGICPSYSGTCMTPYPLRISHRKSFKCICDTDCRKYYKCCEDSCYSHGICKRVIFDTTTTTIHPLGPFFSPIIPRPATIKHMCQGEEQHPGQCPPYWITHPTPLPKYISWNKPYRCKCDSDCKVNYKCCEDSYFEHGVCKPAIRIPTNTFASDDEDIEYSGSGHNINMNENYSGSGAYSGDKDYAIISGNIPITIYNSDDEDIEFSGFDEIISQYSGSGDFSGDKEFERFSGNGRESIYIDNEVLATRFPITFYNSDDEDIEFSGFDEIINQYSGSGDFSGDKEFERFSGSGHVSIHIDHEVLATRFPITLYFNDDEDFEYSGFDIITIDNYNGSGDFSGDTEYEQFSGSGHGPLDNDESAGNEVKHFAIVDKLNVKEKFVDNLNFEFKNTEIIEKPDNDDDDIYFAEPDNSYISQDTETQIYPTNKYTDKHKRNSEDNSNKFENDIHTNNYKRDDDF